MAEQNGTKDRIINESLKLFSRRGYDGVSMREIAAAVGIKGASIYNYFKGKEEIFDTIFTEMTDRYEEAIKSMSVPTGKVERLDRFYYNAGEEQLLVIAEQLFNYFTHDEFAVLFRRLLVSEQHKFARAGDCLKAYYLEAPVKFQTEIFKGIQGLGGFRDCDAEIMAMHFYSPIYYILSQFDLGQSYEEGLLLMKKHVHWFCKLYKSS